MVHNAESIVSLFRWTLTHPWPDMDPGSVRGVKERTEGWLGVRLL